MPQFFLAFLNTVLLLHLVPAGQIPHRRRHRPTIRYFIAAAYSVEGTGADGKWSHPGTVAADPRVLPLNSRIRVFGAGRYSGDYTVEDTGAKVDGHHIDLYMPSPAQAKKFGRQHVKVMILKYGDNRSKPQNPEQKAQAKAIDRHARAATHAPSTSLPGARSSSNDGSREETK